MLAIAATSEFFSNFGVASEYFGVDPLIAGSSTRPYASCQYHLPADLLLSLKHSALPTGIGRSEATSE